MIEGVLSERTFRSIHDVEHVIEIQIVPCTVVQGRSRSTDGVESGTMRSPNRIHLSVTLKWRTPLGADAVEGSSTAVSQRGHSSE